MQFEIHLIHVPITRASHSAPHGIIGRSNGEDNPGVVARSICQKKGRTWHIAAALRSRDVKPAFVAGREGRYAIAG